MRRLCAVFLFLFAACSSANSGNDDLSKKDTTSKKDTIVVRDSIIHHDSTTVIDSTIAQEPAITHVDQPSAIESLIKSGATNIIIIRHAEKSSDGSQDPALSEAGHERAIELTRLLSKIKIGKIYSTPFKRTTQTVQALAVAKNIQITKYETSTSASDLIATIRAEASDDPVVIVAHSNTVPDLIKVLGFTPFTITESDYDNMFVYRQLKMSGQVAKWHLTYGTMTQ
jgi:2,3-bisphosphoglycerate-dependent phosphoglycerate mutase